MEKAWELAIVSGELIAYFPGAIAIFVFVSVSASLGLILKRIYRSKYKKYKKIGLEALPPEKHDNAILLLGKIFGNRSINPSNFELDMWIKNYGDIKKFNEEYAPFVGAVINERENTEKNRENVFKSFLGIWLIITFLLLSGKSTLEAHILTKYSVFHPNLNLEATNIAKEVDLQISTIKALAEKIQSPEKHTIQDVSSALQQLPFELAILRDSLDKQSMENDKLLLETNSKRTELKALQAQQDIVNKLTTKELNGIKALIFGEIRSSSSKFFWIGVVFTFIVQIFLLVLEVPILNLVRKTKFGSKWYNLK